MPTVISNSVIICDIDSTIANQDHRAGILRDRAVLKDKKVCAERGCKHIYRVPEEEEDMYYCSRKGICYNAEVKKELWDKFFDPKAVIKDTPIPYSSTFLNILNKKYPIVYLTGRPVELWSVTIKWLNMFGFPFRGSNYLMMRGKETRYMDSTEYKKKALQYCHHIKFAIDDDELCKEVYEAKGATFLKAPECWEQLWKLKDLFIST